MSRSWLLVSTHICLVLAPSRDCVFVSLSSGLILCSKTVSELKFSVFNFVTSVTLVDMPRVKLGLST